MRLDKKFLAKLLGVSESDITGITGPSFTLTNAPDGIVSFKNLIHERLKKKVTTLATVLCAEDDLGKIVRAHIHIEHELQDFIYFAAPNPTQLKPFKNMEFSEKVQLALMLGLNPELKPALNATGTLRNNFSHRLEMKLGKEEAKNLVATLTPSARQRCQTLLRDTVSALPETSQLTGEGLSYFEVQSQVMAFFVQLFDEVAQERHRLAFQKLEQMALH
jgi:hypothetical protein